MTLAAIYNVFDGEELLAGSVAQIRDQVDHFIFVVSNVGQSGECYDGGVKAVQALGIGEVIHSNERERVKRNIGLKKAKELGCTHFISMDCDEYYFPKDFAHMKQNEVDCVHPLKTYFAKPTFQLTPEESYYVPGICTLNANTNLGNFEVGHLCDPTRKPNRTSLKMGSSYMHHYSYIRKNMQRKVVNSSASRNIMAKQEQLFEDLRKANDGYYTKFFEKSIKLVPNYFDIAI